MSSKNWLILFAITFVSLFLFNFLAHGVVLSNLNADDLAGIRRSPEQLNMMVMVVNYLFQAAAALYFFPKLIKGFDQTKTAITGFMYGGIMFLVTGLNNMFLLPEWPLFVIVTDALANGLVYAALAVEIRYLLKRFV